MTRQSTNNLATFVALLALPLLGLVACVDLEDPDLLDDLIEEEGAEQEAESPSDQPEDDEIIGGDDDGSSVEEEGDETGTDGDSGGEGEEGGSTDDGTGGGEHDGTDDGSSGDQPGAALEPLFCDHPLHDGEEWVELDTGDLIFRYLPGTPAEDDIDRVVADRQAVYDDIVAFLELEERPRVTVVLSPNRMAASHHGYGVGRAVKAASRVEVLWPAGEGSYERERPGHEIAHVLATHVDGSMGRLFFLDEGLAEFLDGSGRDLHREYVDKLVSGHETGFPTRMDDWDAWGRNYGRAGSFVAFLIEQYGRDRFLDLWREAATSGGWSQVTTLGDPVGCGSSLEHALDRLLRRTHGVGFDAVRLAWQATLNPYLEEEPTPVSLDDLDEMLAVLAHSDAAISRGDAVGFRAALEGFYCDSWTDDEKAALARQVVEAYESVETVVVSAFPVGIRNYDETLLHVVRRETRRGETTTLRTAVVWMERFPEGWRKGWSTAW